MTSAQLDHVSEVGAAVNAVDDPKKLKARIVAELRAHYPDSVPAGDKTDEAVFADVLRSNPDLIERVRTTLLVHADTVAPLEAIVAKAVTAAMAGLEPTVTFTMGRRYRVQWPDGSTVVTGADGRRYRVSWPADGIGVDLDEIA